MDKIIEKLKNLKGNDLPYDLSKKVMREIMLYRLRFPLFLSALLLSGLSYLSLRIYSMIVSTGAIEIIKIVISDFEMSFDYISQSWDGLVETLPVFEIQLFLVNILLAAMVGYYVAHVYRKNKKLLINP